MYFTSDRPDGFGGLDIYVIKKLPNGKWSEPQLLPAEVNTDKDEEYPFVHPNGSTLYFNSKGHETVGGYDVFYSKINDDGSYSKAENMCSPINTPDNDICYSLSCDGKTAYIAAIREDSNGEYDIYVINDRSSDENLIVYSGKVRYADNAIPKGVSVWVKDKTTGEDLGSYSIDENGEFLCYLQPKDDYSLTYSKNGETLQENSKTPTKEEEDNFKRMGAPVALEDVILPLLNKETEVTVADGGLTVDGATALDDVLNTTKDMKEESRELVVNIEHDEKQIPKDSQQMKSVLDYLSGTVNSSDITYNNKPTDKNVYNVKVSYGSGIAGNDIYGGGKRTLSDTVEIYNIYFDFDKSDIMDKYKENLNKLSEYMIDNPGCQIEIGGHTDNVGTDEYNMLLSGRRARAVKDYLVAKGVKQDKVIEKKYGEGSPIASNGSSNTRKYNRRVAFKVLEQGSEKYLKIVEENVGNGSNSSKATATTANGTKIYRVQLFALTKSKPVESFGIPNLKVREVNGVYKYYLGDFSSNSEAQKILDGIKDKYPEAIILESF
jgi:outer membrane protein OmpA-like peptidoglycan-associated protein